MGAPQLPRLTWAPNQDGDQGYLSAFGFWLLLLPLDRHPAWASQEALARRLLDRRKKGFWVAFSTLLP